MVIHAATDNDIYPPLFGGAQRAFGLARGMARRHEVRVLCVVPNRTAAPREQVVDRVALVRRKAWYTSAAWRLERLGLAPMAVVIGWHAAAARRLLAQLPGTPQALCADLTLSGLFTTSHAPLAVYTAHNVEYDHFAATGARVLGRARWAERVREAEARAVERADLTVVCSEEDAARMAELYGADRARLHVAPNGFDETRISAPDPEARERARAALGLAPEEYVALFVGSDVPHNREALGFLTGRVLPALAGERVRLIVAGSVVRALGGPHPPWLIPVPETPDLTPVLHAADAGLNPVARGGGSNVKLPTYLAAGLAAITTPFGLRGYPNLAPSVVTSEREHTADALRARPAGWRARGLACPAAVRDYAWGRIGERLAEAIEALPAAEGRIAGERSARA